MRSPSNLNTFLIIVFLIMWLYTEITEYNERTVHQIKVDNFMTRGDRFTAEDGRALEARIQALENHERLKAKVHQNNG